MNVVRRMVRHHVQDALCRVAGPTLELVHGVPYEMLQVLGIAFEKGCDVCDERLGAGDSISGNANGERLLMPIHLPSPTWLTFGVEPQLVTVALLVRAVWPLFDLNAMRVFFPANVLSAMVGPLGNFGLELFQLQSGKWNNDE